MISPSEMLRLLRDEVGEAVRRELEMGIDTGTATGGTGTTLEDTSKDWGTNEFARAYVEITSGTGKGQIREIDSNTGAVLTAVTDWTTAPDETSDYRIFGAPAVLRAIQSEQPRGLASWGGTGLTGADITDNIQSIDVGLGTRAAETTLADVKNRLTSIEGKIATKSATPTVTSHTATAADTEYSFDLPAGTKRFTLKARGGRIDMGFASGARPIQIADGGAAWEEMLDLPGAVTIFYSSPTAGAVAEVWWWV